MANSFEFIFVLCQMTTIEIKQFTNERFLSTGAPNDRFLSNAFRCCFRLSGVLLKLCRLILACTKKTFICSDIPGELEYSRIY